MSDETPQDGGPAFPRDFILDTSKSECQWLQIGSEGMSLRDYFAGKALCGLMSKVGCPKFDKNNAERAQSCYWIADAMLTARQTNIT